jgi:hypothetical protein
VAALIKREIGIEAQLMQGRIGEFSVWVDERRVAQKHWLRLPQDEQVLAAVRAALRA